MSDPKEVETDIREFLIKYPHMSHEDRIKYLMAVFDKHFIFQKLDYVLTYHDFFDIVSSAKQRYPQLKTPMMISKRDINGHDLAHVALIESIVSFLYSRELLKKMIKFDYTDRK